MSTTEQPAMSSDGIAEYAREHIKDAPDTVLEIVLAATEQLRAENEQVKETARKKSEVRRNEDGRWECPTMDAVQRLAKMYAATEMIPAHLKGKIADVTILVHLALRRGDDPLTVLQKCYVVHGKPGVESQLAIAWANTSGVLSDRIYYQLDGEGDARFCTARATVKTSGQTIEHTIDVATVKKMGWWTKKDSLWPKMTDLMLKYRAAMWLIRTSIPEVLMGFYSIDELKDMDAPPKPPGRAEALLGGLEPDGTPIEESTSPPAAMPAAVPIEPQAVEPQGSLFDASAEDGEAEDLNARIEEWGGLLEDANDEAEVLALVEKITADSLIQRHPAGIEGCAKYVEMARTRLGIKE